MVHIRLIVGCWGWVEALSRVVGNFWIDFTQNSAIRMVLFKRRNPVIMGSCRLLKRGEVKLLLVAVDDVFSRD